MLVVREITQVVALASIVESWFVESVGSFLWSDAHKKFFAYIYYLSVTGKIMVTKYL